MDNLEISMLSEVNQTKTNIIYVEFKKMIQISLFTKQTLSDIGNKLICYQRGKRRKIRLGVWF